MEPALTNIGIVLPRGRLPRGGARRLHARGTLLIVDETHTLSAGPGGCTAAWGLEPDAVTLGKSIGGGVPIGAYGVTAELAERIADEDADYEDTGGVGGTLAGNALSLAAARATLGEVLTDEAFARMSRCASASSPASRRRSSATVPWSSSAWEPAPNTASARSRPARARSRRRPATAPSRNICTCF